MPYKTFNLSCTLFFLLFSSVSAESAKTELPYSEIQKEYVEKVRDVVKHRSFHRLLKKVTFVGTDEVYDFLLERMPFAADAVRGLRLQNYRVSENGDGTYTADDGAGATGTYTLVYKEKGKKIFYALGKYKGTFLRIRGRVVAIVEFKEEPSKEMQNRVQVYFKFDNLVIGTMAKLVSPFLGGLIDKKISYFLDAVRQLCQRIVEGPEQVYAQLQKSKEVSPENLVEFKTIFVDGVPGDSEASIGN